MPTKNSLVDISKSRALALAFEYLVFAFMALTLVLYRSFNLLGMLLVVIASIAVAKNLNNLPRLDRESHWLFIILIANLLLASCYVIIGRDSPGILQDPLTMMCMIPMMLAVPILGLQPRRLFLGLALGMLAAALVVSYQYYRLGVYRPAISLNPNPFSEIAMVSCALLLSSLLSCSGWKKTLSVLGALAAFYCVIISETRGTLIAVISMGMVAGVVFLKYRPRFDLSTTGQGKKYLTIGIAAIILIFAGLAFQYGSGISKRLATAVDNFTAYYSDRSYYSSLSVRMELWYSVWLSFKEAPLTGIGSDNRIQYLADLESAGKVYLNNYPWRHSHSDYLDSLQRQGLPGMLLVITLYGVLARLFWRGLNTDSNEQFTLALGGLMVVTGYATFSLTEVPLRNTPTLVFFTVLVGVLLGLSKQDQKYPG
ncbi:MAG: O-antigen ligase family protein [Gammaproteobacteria bacterium]|nr:O-antigen ligase family protein [Gammaproteobacteria bacterium]MDH3537511.1 O-antigen ligase family protein [Gammaproteobacteria bacterium]